MCTIKIVILLVCATVAIQAANILVGLPLSSKSHKNVFRPLVFELARRGHKVSIISPYKDEQTVDGVTDIVVPDLVTIDNYQEKYVPDEQGTRPSMIVNPSNIGPFYDRVCKKFLGSEPMKQILSQKEKFDLLILDMIIGQCGVGVAYKLQIPFIYISPNAGFLSMDSNLRLPVPTSFVPSVLYTFTDEMTFLQRLENLVYETVLSAAAAFFMKLNVDKTTRECLGDDVPSVMDIEKNVSVILMNSDPVLNYPRPLMPHVIEIGGMQCRPPKPLPKDLEKWIEGSGKYGFIYMSFGSIFPASQIPNKFKKIFLDAFSKIPQRVLWKLKTSSDIDVPDNVRLTDWAPQQDVLGHPSAKLFISHGGMLSVQESTYHAVPILGIPAAIDQMHNLVKIEKDKVGIKLEWEELTLETFSSALNSILTNSSYKERAKEKSAAMIDRPRKPLDEGAFWVEYVLRHKGAPHLRSGALKLPLYQFYQADVIAFLLSLGMAFVFLLYYITKCTITRCCLRSQKSGDKGISSKKKTKSKKE